MRRLLWLALLGGCTYTPHSFSGIRDGFPGTQIDLGGCLDLAVAATTDPLATGHVVSYSFGNRCGQRVGVDLASVRAVEVGLDGVRRPLRVFDPKHDIVAMPVESRWYGSERIQYLAELGQTDAFAQVCVDVGGIDRSVPVRGEHWVCVGVPGDQL
jgi:hypothetical protein